MVSGIESVTVGVRDIETAFLDYRDRLGLVVLFDTFASVGLLSAWRRPAHEGVRLVELGAPNGAGARVRLAQFECELTAESSKDALVVGPQALAAPHATITIVTDDAAASRRFYVEGFGWREIRDLPAGMPVPPGGSFRWSGFASAGASGIDVAVAHRAERRIPRRKDPALPGRLGVDLATCRCADLDEAAKRLAAIGVEPLARPVHVGLPGGLPGRVMLVRGPADELFELVEPEA